MGAAGRGMAAGGFSGGGGMLCNETVVNGHILKTTGLYTLKWLFLSPERERDTNYLPRGTTWKAKPVSPTGLLAFFCLSANTTLRGPLFVLGRPHPCLQSRPRRSQWRGEAPRKPSGPCSGMKPCLCPQLQGRCPMARGLEVRPRSQLWHRAYPLLQPVPQQCVSLSLGAGIPSPF